MLDCRPPLLPVSMDISGVDLSAGRLPATSAGMDGLLPGSEPLSKGGDLLGLICPELGVVPLVDVGRGRGGDTCSLGGGGLAGDGDAHC